MKSGVSFIKGTNDFISKLKNLGKIQENAFLVTADVVGLHQTKASRKIKFQKS